MFARTLSFAALTVSVLALSLGATKAYPQNPGKTITRTLVSLELRDNYVDVEGKYEGALERGGGSLCAYATWYCHNSYNNQSWFEEENVSLLAEWEVLDENIYWVEFNVTLFDTGLYVDPTKITVESGTTSVAVTYQSLGTLGTIEVKKPWR